METGKGNVIITFDDVIAYSTYTLYKHLCNNFSFYNKYIDVYKIKTKKQIYERSEYNLIEYLKRKKVFDVDVEEQVKMFNNLFLHLYNGFYNINNKIELTPFAKNGVLNPYFNINSGISNIYIIVKYHTETEKENKVNFINSTFKSNKISILTQKFDEDYYNIVKTLSWNILITDDVNCIEKLAGGNIDHKEFLMPLYGYNVPKQELLELIKLKSATLSYYTEN